MTKLDLKNAETLQLTLSSGARIYVSEHEKGGLHVLGDRGFLIEPRTDNSVRIIPQLLDKEQRLLSNAKAVIRRNGSPAGRRTERIPENEKS